MTASTLTYGHWRKPKTKGMFGLGSAGTLILFVGLILTILVLATSGWRNALILAALVLIFMGGVVIRDRHHQTIGSRVLRRVGWARRRAEGSTTYISGPLGKTVGGTFQPPGLLASFELTEHLDGYNRRFGLLKSPSTDTYAVVIDCSPPGDAGVDAEQVDDWVAEWGGWLLGLGEEVDVVAGSVTIETAPATGHQLERQVRARLAEATNPPEFAVNVMEQRVRDLPAAASSINAYVTVVVGQQSNKGRDRGDLAREVAGRLPMWTEHLQQTGAGAAFPVTGERLCEIVKIAYDPAAETLIEEAHAEGQPTGLTWTDCGPSVAKTGWTGYRHDSGYSRTWTMSSAPRGQVRSHILRRVLMPHRAVHRKRVTTLYLPIDPAKAAELVQDDVQATEWAITTSKRPSAAAIMDHRAARATEDEEASGAGLVEFGMVITGTVLAPGADADLREAAFDAEQAISNVAARARLVLHPAYAGEDAAFAAALPIGLIPRDHVDVPKWTRNL